VVDAVQRMTEFRLAAHRFWFEARERVSFGPSAANTFRGAFGHILRRVASPGEYARWFEPAARGGPSGFADPPRPFVIRAHELDGREFGAGDRLSIDVHAFLGGAEAVFGRVFEELGRLRLVGSECREVVAPVVGDEGHEGLTLVFRTPTELKSGGAVLREAPFEVVVARAADRVGELTRLYGAGELELDHRGLRERARAVRMTSSALSWASRSRTSSRTGQTHPVGGFVGPVRYDGPVGEFVPLLRAAYWTGIGRQTVWGKGVIEVELPCLPRSPVQ
jgi:hypothetical protein